MAVDPIPNPPHTPQPPISNEESINLWRQSVERGLADINRWPRPPFGFFDREPTTADDSSFGYLRGFIWIAQVSNGGVPAE